MCAISKCSNDYLCRTDACKKNLQIELLERIEHYSNLAPPLSLRSSCEKERKQRFSQEQHHFEESKYQNPSQDQVSFIYKYSNMIICSNQRIRYHMIRLINCFNCCNFIAYILG